MMYVNAVTSWSHRPLCACFPVPVCFEACTVHVLGGTPGCARAGPGPEPGRASKAATSGGGPWSAMARCTWTETRRWARSAPFSNTREKARMETRPERRPSMATTAKIVAPDDAIAAVLGIRVCLLELRFGRRRHTAWKVAERHSIHNNDE